MIAEDLAAVSGPIVAEVASGALTLAMFQRVSTRLHALATLEVPADVWEQVARARFSLARQGVQAHLVDLAIAVTANAHAHRLLTRDRDFVAIARVVPLDLDLW